MGLLLDLKLAVSCHSQDIGSCTIAHACMYIAIVYTDANLLLLTACIS